MTKRRRDRFERFKIIFPILLAGWIPSILTLIVSYTILRDTLESRILRDRQTLIQLVGHLVAHDLNRSSSVIEYYQTLPEVVNNLSAPNPQVTQQWLNSAFYSHPQIDGMFITTPNGDLIASIPTGSEMIGKDFGSEYWREQAATADATFVSAIHPRLSDNRAVTDIVGAVRAPDRTILGYVGVSVLVERIGRRLSAIEFSDRLVFEVLDQNGVALFASDFKPNPVTPAPKANEGLIKEISQSRSGHFERQGNLYSFSPIESSGWVAVVEQPRTLAYKPVHDLLGRMTVLAAWLIVLTAVFAWLGSGYYQRQLEAKQRLEREVIFNEKMLANMPSGIAFIDPASRRFLHANYAFAHMAERFGDVPAGRDVTETTYEDVKIAPPGAIERVLTFGTPFQLIEHPLKDKTGMTHFLNVNLLRLQGPHETIQGVLYLVEDKTREAEFHLRATQTHVEGDPARLQQVFWNLIKNSVKFTPEKGRITIETVNPAPDKIEVRIIDTGIGIDPEQIDKIFNAFEQGQAEITRRFGGLGLGLAISKALIDAHGGKIRVESPGRDKGATFSLKLNTVVTPAGADGDRKDLPAGPERELAVARHRRVLLVDDHHDTCIGMKRMLERHGYEITVAHSADQAVEKVRTQDFDLLISDIGLPDRSGYELMREVRLNKNLPGIALSGFGTEQDVNQARAAGFAEHLTKPINFERLERTIQNLLS